MYLVMNERKQLTRMDRIHLLMSQSTTERHTAVMMRGDFQQLTHTHALLLAIGTIDFESIPTKSVRWVEPTDVKLTKTDVSANALVAFAESDVRQHSVEETLFLVREAFVREVIQHQRPTSAVCVTVTGE